MIGRRPGRLLVGHPDLPATLQAWLEGRPPLGEAGRELASFLDGAEPVGPAPLWAARQWRQGWLDALLPDLPDEAARERARDGLARLAAGRAEVVVTGQQPGFLGGPLYTLYKAATAVAAAAARTRRGRPTVPLFWSGDADDDRLEAFRPWLHDPERDALLRAPVPPGPNGLMLGSAPAAAWSTGEAAWLARVAGRGGDGGPAPAAGRLAADLAAAWREAVDGGWSWSRLHRRFLLRLFGGAGLLVVSGSDPGLHEAAAPLYDRLRPRLAELARLVAERGRALAAAGYPAQLGEASLERILNRAEGGRRLALPAEAAAGVPARELRPGVAARSLVQDWLLRPAGVVVGPAELAYLKQLESAYEAFGVARAPLLPRLFGVCVPARLAEREAGGSGSGTRERAVEEAAARVGEAAAVALGRELRRTAGLDAGRAAELAGEQARRWRAAARRVLAAQAERRAREETGEDPAWLRPRGHRQERSMAAGWAAALWGDDLASAAVAAAAAHLDEGAAGRWREWIFEVPEPGAGPGEAR